MSFSKIPQSIDTEPAVVESSAFSLCHECTDDSSSTKRKFSRLKIQNKKTTLQKELTDLAFAPCCSKQCLKTQFVDPDDPNQFNFGEAKKCFDYYLNIYQFKSKIEYQNFIYDQFVGTCYGLDEGDRIIHNFKLQYGPTEKRQTVSVCRDVWAFFLNATSHLMKTLSICYKSNYSAIGTSVNRNCLFTDQTNHQTDLDEMKTIFQEQNIECDLTMQQMGTIGRHEIETFIWFRDHFDLIGDSMPNTDGEIHIDKIEKQDIYILYVNEVGKGCLTYSSWLKFWKKVFPHVKVRQWKNVSGKCEHCGIINNGRLVAQSEEEVKAFRKLHLLHKAGNFMLERLAYHMRRQESLNDSTILSLILDTMDNTHCCVPYLGSGDSFDSPIKQGILGCYAHGQNTFTIYRTTGTSILLYPKYSNNY